MPALPSYDAVSRCLRGEIIEHYYHRGESIEGDAGVRTLDTNSTLVPQRAELLVELFARRSGRASLEGLDLVDLGCGFGAMSLYFACSGARVVGVDPNDERFVVGARVAKQLDLPVSFRRGWIEALPLADSSFDLIVLNNSFCYLTDDSDRRCALEHLFRVARPEACLAMRNPSLAAILDPFTRMPVIHQMPRRLAKPLLKLSARGRARSDVRLRSGTMAKRELRRAGFEQVRVEKGMPERRPGNYQHITARRSGGGSEVASRA